MTAENILTLIGIKKNGQFKSKRGCESLNIFFLIFALDQSTKKGIFLREMCKRKKSGLELARASNERRYQRHSQ